MKKFFILTLVLATSGCAMVDTAGNGTQQRVYFMQRGIVLQVVHTCTAQAKLYQGGRGFVSDISGVVPQQIPLMPSVMGESHIDVVLQSIQGGSVVAVYTQRFRVDRHSTTAQTWVIGDSSGGGTKRTRCHRQ